MGYRKSGRYRFVTLVQEVCGAKLRAKGEGQVNGLVVGNGR